jgi:hypothetical protein
MPKAQICLCRSHGCADAERKSTVTGQILKGRYLNDMEYRSHQRYEMASKRSSSVLPQVAINGSDLSPLPSSPPRLPTRSIPKSVLTSAAPSPGTEVFEYQPHPDNAPSLEAGMQPQHFLEHMGEHLCLSQVDVSVMISLHRCSITKLWNA